MMGAGLRLSYIMQKYIYLPPERKSYAGHDDYIQQISFLESCTDPLLDVILLVPPAHAQKCLLVAPVPQSPAASCPQCVDSHWKMKMKLSASLR